MVKDEVDGKVTDCAVFTRCFRLVAVDTPTCCCMSLQVSSDRPRPMNEMAGKDEEAARDKSFASNIPQIALLWQASEHTEPKMGKFLQTKSFQFLHLGFTCRDSSWKRSRLRFFQVSFDPGSILKGRCNSCVESPCRLSPDPCPLAIHLPIYQQQAHLRLQTQTIALSLFYSTTNWSIDSNPTNPPPNHQRSDPITSIIRQRPLWLMQKGNWHLCSYVCGHSLCIGADPLSLSLSVWLPKCSLYPPGLYCPSAVLLLLCLQNCSCRPETTPCFISSWAALIWV